MLSQEVHIWRLQQPVFPGTVGDVIYKFFLSAFLIVTSFTPLTL